MSIDYGSNDVSTSGNFIAHSGSFTTGLTTSGAISVNNLKLASNTISSTNSNGNIVIQPSGTGALQRDGGGNARGQYSVDWQAIRGSATDVASGNYSVIGGGQSNAASGPRSTVGGGYNNTASGNYSAVGGGQSNNAINNYTTVGGGSSNTASGSYSTVGGGFLNTASGTRSTVGGGASNNASGSRSTVGGGFSNNAINNSSTVGGGYINTASGSRSTVGGGFGNTASGFYSTVNGGLEAVASLYGEDARSSGKFNTASDAQIRRFILRGRDTTTTALNLRLDGDLYSSRYLYIPEYASWYYTIKVIARDALNPSTASYTFEGVIENEANDGVSSAHLVNTKNVIYEDESGWDCNLSIVYNGNDPYLNIQCSFNSYTTEDVYWVANVEVTQVRIPAPSPSS